MSYPTLTILHKNLWIALQLAGITVEGAKLASKINPADAAAASGSVLELLKEVGAQ